MKFPKDASKQKVIKTFEILGFKVVRVGNHISMVRENPDGSKNAFNHAKSQEDKRLYFKNDLQTSWNTKGGISKSL